MMIMPETRTIPGILTKLNRVIPENTAFLYEENRHMVSVTYRKVYEDVFRVADSFSSLSGERVGILGSNSYMWICHAWGLLTAHAVTAFLDPMMPAADLKEIIRRAQLNVLVFEKSLQDFCTQLTEEFPEIRCIPFRTEEELSVSNSALTANNRLSEDSEALFFTSGTTKNSKIAVTPVSAIIGNFLRIFPNMNIFDGDLVFIPLPFHHSFGFAKQLMYFSQGHPIFLSSMMHMLSDLKKVQPQLIMIVPSAAEFLLKKNAFPKSLKTVHISGAYCSVELADRIRACAPVVQNEYGSSEIPGGIGINLAGDEVDTLTLSEGIHTEILPDGELVIFSQFHLKEYYRDPEATGEVLDRQGRVHTGDVGFLDAKGCLHIQGRRKNMLIMENGEKISYADIDEALSHLSGVQAAAALYVNKNLVAVLRPEADPSSDCSVAEALQSEIDRYNQEQPIQRKIRKIWIYPSSFPYTTSGKLMRRKLEEEYIACISRNSI